MNCSGWWAKVAWRHVGRGGRYTQICWWSALGDGLSPAATDYRVLQDYATYILCLCNQNDRVLLHDEVADT